MPRKITNKQETNLSIDEISKIRMKKEAHINLIIKDEVLTLIIESNDKQKEGGKR